MSPACKLQGSQVPRICKETIRLFEFSRLLVGKLRVCCDEITKVSKNGKPKPRKIVNLDHNLLFSRKKIVENSSSDLIEFILFSFDEIFLSLK